MTNNSFINYKYMLLQLLFKLAYLYLTITCVREFETYENTLQLQIVSQHLSLSKIYDEYSNVLLDVNSSNLHSNFFLDKYVLNHKSMRTRYACLMYFCMQSFHSYLIHAINIIIRVFYITTIEWIC